MWLNSVCPFPIVLSAIRSIPPSLSFFHLARSPAGYAHHIWPFVLFSGPCGIPQAAAALSTLELLVPLFAAVHVQFFEPHPIGLAAGRSTFVPRADRPVCFFCFVVNLCWRGPVQTCSAVPTFHAMSALVVWQRNCALQLLYSTVSHHPIATTAFVFFPLLRRRAAQHCFVPLSSFTHSTESAWLARVTILSCLCPLRTAPLPMYDINPSFIRLRANWSWLEIERVYNGSRTTVTATGAREKMTNVSTDVS